jgi:phosphatidyl-myo-inositol dimannoside synthase
MKHLLVTNDFPPKHGGIQNYLWELWRRLPSDSFVVYTTPFAGTTEWDAAQPFEVIRSREPVLLPHPLMARRVDSIADRVGADLVLLDPALPIGAIGPSLRHRYGVVLHGAEVTVPGRVPALRTALARVLSKAEIVIAAGGYPAAEAIHAARRDLPIVIVPPGVDTDRFRPLSATQKRDARTRLGIDPDAVVVLGQSRLVPRKGFDILIRAAAQLAPQRPTMQVLIGGAGRDRERLEKLAAELHAPARFLGRVPDADLADVFGLADVFAMVCRNRWGGLEQEGFGIVFTEAAAAGVPQIAGRSGGSHEAVVDGETGFVVDEPSDVNAVADALARLVDDSELRERMGAAARTRAEREGTYDGLAARLAGALDALGSNTEELGP